MVWYTDGAPVRSDIEAGENPASIGSVLSNLGADVWESNPLVGLYDERVLSAQERGRPIMSRWGRWTGKYEPAPTRTLSLEEARSRTKAAGVNVDIPVSGIPEGALQILIDRKREQQKRAEVLRRDPGGFLSGAGKVATALTVSALDPINLGSAFIPVVGEARYAGMLAKASGPLERAAIRAGVGAIEGAVGAAVVEPIVYGSQRRLQGDYDLTDSLLNIAIGGVLGGGLHVATGAGGTGVERAVEDLPPQARANLAAEAMTALIEGREPRVKAMVEAMAEAAPRRVPVVAVDPADIGGSIERFTTAALGKSKSEVLRTGGVPDIAVKTAKKVGIDIAGFEHVMQSDDIRHVLKVHGEGATLRPDELPVTMADIAKVPEIIAAPDLVRAEKTRQGLDALVFTKREGGTFIVVEEVRAGKKRLAFKSMRIKKAGERGPGTIDAPEAPQSLRPDREPGTATGNVDLDPTIDNLMENWAPERQPVQDLHTLDAPRSAEIDPIDAEAMAAAEAAPVLSDDPVTDADRMLAEAEAQYQAVMTGHPNEGRQALFDALKADDLDTEARVKATQAAAGCLIRAGA